VQTAYANANQRFEHWAPAAQALSDDRLHLHYGPIDLIIDVDANANERSEAFAAARCAFDGVLEGLVHELPQLRAEVKLSATAPTGAVAQRMWAACLPHADQFVTSMAAVAGAVADHVLAAMVVAAPNAKRLWVNNGGDIALRLSAHETATIAVCTASATRAANVTISSDAGVGGIATSGWRGRSSSFGIADAVTVLAPTAAAADVAATLIANQVHLHDADLDNRYVTRCPANELNADSDLTDQPITVAVGALSRTHVAVALNHGLRAASKLAQQAPLHAVFIHLQGQSATLGDTQC